MGYTVTSTTAPTIAEATFTAAVETGAFYISIEYQTATANT